MMEAENNNNNNLFARWLANDLNPEEKEKMTQSGDAETLQKIVSTVDTWSLPNLHPETLNRIKEKTSPKVVSLFQKPWAYALAASIAIVISLAFWLFNSNKTEMVELACNAGETKVITLDDSTIVTLSGASRFTYNNVDFKDQRVVSMQGEIYFNVRKKGHFQVNFEGGNIKVLGTQFTVLNKNNVTSVKCFEGKVQVGLGNQNTYLTKGMGVRKVKSKNPENFNVDTENNLPTAAEIRFKETPLEEVCASLSSYYNINIMPNNVDLQRNYTGQYRKTNLDTALLMVFEPMGINFKKDGNKVILNNK